jgi:hypothetical protein
MRWITGACLAGCGLLLLALPVRASSFGVNLIVNGDAESDPSSATGYEIVPAITGWTRTDNLTVVSWTTGGGFPVNADPGPAVRGASFFAGGPSSAASEMTQTIDISDLAGTIDGGTAGYRLGGSYNDGYADSLTLVLSPTTAGVEGAPVAALEFSAVAPNPARSGARFAFRLSRSADVRLELLDPQGRRVAVLVEGACGAGPHSVDWKRPAGVRPGVYLARLQADGQTQQRRFVLLD